MALVERLFQHTLNKQVLPSKPVASNQSIILSEGYTVTASGARLPEIKRFEVVEEEKIEVFCIFDGKEIHYFLEGEEINSPSANLVTKPDLFGLYRKYSLNSDDDRPRGILS
jgi:hypothetical protein